MEYIGSQNASRGRRQRRSKCKVFSTRLLPPAAFTCRVSLPVQRRLPASAVLPPCTPRLRDPTRLSRLPLRALLFLRILAGAKAGGPGVNVAPAPSLLKVRESVPIFVRLALAICAFLPWLGRGAGAPGILDTLPARCPRPLRKSRGEERPRRRFTSRGCLAQEDLVRVANCPRASRGASERAPARRLLATTHGWSRRARGALRVRVSTRLQSRSRSHCGEGQRTAEPSAGSRRCPVSS